jgi:cytochrome b6-f complex iron-sulfur subunit
MTNNSDNKISRKEFFRRLGTFTLLPVGFIWYSSVARGKEGISKTTQLKLTAPINKGITFKDEIIINRDDRGVKIFSSRCTHLGCRLNKIENNEIVCPCHGSGFSKNGKVLKGPADKNLKQLEYRVDKSSKEIIIDVPA